MASIYAAVLPKLKDEEEEVNAYTLAKTERKIQLLEEIDPQTKQPIKWDPVRLAERYAKARREQERIGKELYQANLDEAVLLKMLVDSYQASEDGWGTHGATPETIRLATGDSIRLQPEPVLKIDDREQWRAFCLQDADLAATMNPHWQKANSLMKERLLRDEEPPPGTSVWKRWRAVFTDKQKKKAKEANHEIVKTSLFETE
jgi:hypothetical protein